MKAVISTFLTSHTWPLTVCHLTLGLALSLTGCRETGSSSDDRVFTNSSGVTVNPSAPETDMLITLSVGADMADMKSYNWVVTRDDGSLASSCAGSTPSIQCTFTIGGDMKASVTALDNFGDAHEASASFTVIDTAQAKNQPPQIVADFYRSSDGTLVATYATDTALESGTMNVPKGSYTLRLSRTRDDNDALSAIAFTISVNGGAPLSIGASKVLNFASVAAYPITLTATDSSGSVTTKKLTVYSQCSPAEAGPIVADASNISVAATATRSYFRYSVAGVSGGTGRFKYMWDFNGDKIYDNDWTSNAVITEYSLYGSNRQIGLKIWDTTCNYFKSVTKDVVLPVAKEPVDKANPSVSVANLHNSDYYFLQADISPLTDTMAYLDHLQRADFQGNLKKVGPPTGRGAFCQYVRAGRTDTPASLNGYLNVYAYNQYSRSLEPYQNRLMLAIKDIKDLMGTATPTIDTSGAYIYQAEYVTDAGGDQSSQLYYTRTAACSLTLKIQPSAGVAPCAGGAPGGAKYSLVIEGIFHCPQLTSGSRQIQVGRNDGAFYCEIKDADACIGGGPVLPGEPPVPR